MSVIPHNPLLSLPSFRIVPVLTLHVPPPFSPRLTPFQPVLVIVDPHVFHSYPRCFLLSLFASPLTSVFVPHSYLFHALFYHPQLASPFPALICYTPRPYLLQIACDKSLVY